MNIKCFLFIKKSNQLIIMREINRGRRKAGFSGFIHLNYY